MGDKDLESIISGIGEKQDEMAKQVNENKKLQQLILKQKSVIDEHEGLIKELQSKLGTMYDMPADVEALKGMIGSQRGQIDDKNHQLEMTHAQVTEFKNELAVIKSQNADYKDQLAEIRSNLSDKTLNLERAMGELEETKLLFAEDKNHISELETDISTLRGKLEETSVNSKSAQTDIESTLKGKIFELNSKYQDEIGQLKSQLIDKDMEIKELARKAERAENDQSSSSNRVQDIIARNDELESTLLENETEIRGMKDSVAVLESENKKFQNLGVTLEALSKLFEEEPFFKMFNLVRSVGEMSEDMLQGALAIPQITLKKYVQKFIDVELFERNEETGKIRLVHRL